MLGSGRSLNTQILLCGYDRLKDSVTSWIFIYFCLNILIITFCVCADGFSRSLKSFSLPYIISNFLSASLN
jgi:hypothetical protein